MKKLVLLLLIPLFSLSSFGQTKEVIEPHIYGGNVKYYVDKYGKRQGEGIRYYESGAVKSKVNYVDGKRQGERSEYYESGAINYISN